MVDPLTLGKGRWPQKAGKSPGQIADRIGPEIFLVLFNHLAPPFNPLLDRGLWISGPLKLPSIRTTTAIIVLVAFSLCSFLL